MMLLDLLTRAISRLYRRSPIYAFAELDSGWQAVSLGLLFFLLTFFGIEIGW